MDVFGKGIEVRGLKPPGICFLCEATPIQDSERVINTMRIFSPGPLTNLNGTKYVCESCAHDLGVAIGLVDPVEYEAVVDEAATLKIKLDEAQTENAAYESLGAAVRALGGSLAPVEAKVAEEKAAE